MIVPGAGDAWPESSDDWAKPVSAIPAETPSAATVASRSLRIQNLLNTPCEPADVFGPDFRVSTRPSASAVAVGAPRPRPEYAHRGYKPATASCIPAWQFRNTVADRTQPAFQRSAAIAPAPAQNRGRRRAAAPSTPPSAQTATPPPVRASARPADGPERAPARMTSGRKAGETNASEAPARRARSSSATPCAELVTSPRRAAEGAGQRPPRRCTPAPSARASRTSPATTRPAAAPGRCAPGPGLARRGPARRHGAARRPRAPAASATQRGADPGAARVGEQPEHRKAFGPGCRRALTARAQATSLWSMRPPEPSVAAATIAENLRRIRARIAEAALRAGRRPEDVTLVAVSKTHPAASVAGRARSRADRVRGEPGPGSRREVSRASRRFPAAAPAHRRRVADQQGARCGAPRRCDREPRPAAPGRRRRRRDREGGPAGRRCSCRSMSATRRRNAGVSRAEADAIHRRVQGPVRPRARRADVHSAGRSGTRSALHVARGPRRPSRARCRVDGDVRRFRDRDRLRRHIGADRQRVIRRAGLSCAGSGFRHAPSKPWMAGLRQPSTAKPASLVRGVGPAIRERIRPPASGRGGPSPCRSGRCRGAPGSRAPVPASP